MEMLIPRNGCCSCRCPPWRGGSTAGLATGGVCSRESLLGAAAEQGCSSCTACPDRAALVPRKHSLSALLPAAPVGLSKVVSHNFSAGTWSFKLRVQLCGRAFLGAHCRAPLPTALLPWSVLQGRTGWRGAGRAVLGFSGAAAQAAESGRKQKVGEENVIAPIPIFIDLWLIRIVLKS